jgi:hypothetical protein
MVPLRRLLLLLLLMFWLGGFTFYAAVVVPIGAEVLGGAEEQGWITRRVTFWLNVAGAPAVLAWAWDLAADPAPTRLRQTLRWLLWLAIALILAALALLHPRLDALLDTERFRIIDRAAFRSLHRLYLWLSTAQWGAGILLTYSTIRAWRDADCRVHQEFSSTKDTKGHEEDKNTKNDRGRGDT